MQENNDIQDIWELYGVKENPFSISPIMVMGGAIPIDSFVGRGEFIKRLSRIIGSKGGSRVFVYGDIGIGKTSFVNVVRSSAVQKGFFTHFKEITTQDKWTPDEFVLNTLSAIYSTLKLLKEKPVSKDTYDRLESLFEIGKTSISAGISVAGFGGNYASQKKSPDVLPSVSLQSFFAELIEEINNNTKKEVIIHYNNLELMSEKKIRSLFGTLRDYFQTKGVHFIFIGNLTAFSILQSVPRFSSILSDTPFHIETLIYNEVIEVIRKRFEGLRISEKLNLIYPYNEHCLKILYELMDGNIRDILNSLSTAVFHATTESPVKLDKNKLARVLNEVLEKRYLNRLTPREREVLGEIIKHKEITNKALSDKLKIPRSNISNYIKDLENSGCVFLRRKNGKDKFWKADPKIKWLLLKEDSQQTLPT
ncbi:MAG TPA: winged helix-turn-helix transcriptional regulator [Candidatus Nanoarchaeia archaeon]|nr:winged helix-turn-helix transcriptional regulator [Candidatus Nanoarchaeia archaeon]